MGEELRGNFIMKTYDGKEYQFENAIINEVTVEPGIKTEVRPEDDYVKTEVVGCPTYEFSIQTQNMTRKRFIKLIMSRGVARNGAKDIADYIYRKYGHYNLMYLLMF